MTNQAYEDRMLCLWSAVVYCCGIEVGCQFERFLHLDSHTAANPITKIIATDMPLSKMLRTVSRNGLGGALTGVESNPYVMKNAEAFFADSVPV